MLFNTKEINNDPNFIQNHGRRIIHNVMPFPNPRKNAFIQNAVEFYAGDIIVYLLSFKNIAIPTKFLNSFVCQLLLPKKLGNFNEKTLVESVKLLIQHPNFNHQRFRSTRWVDSQTILEYTLRKFYVDVYTNSWKHWFNDFNKLQEDMIQLMISFGNSNAFESKQDKKDFINYNGINCFPLKHATALHLACEYKDYKTIDTLLQNEYIDVNVTDSNGDTPFMIICGHPPWEYDDDNDGVDQDELKSSKGAVIQRMFANKDFDMYKKNDKKETCLLIAMGARNENMVKTIGEYLNKEYEKSDSHKKQIKKFLQEKGSFERTVVCNMSALYNDLFAHLE